MAVLYWWEWGWMLAITSSSIVLGQKGWVKSLASVRKDYLRKE